MNFTLKQYTETKDELTQYLSDIEDTFDNLPEGLMYEEKPVSDFYSDMYGAVEDCIFNQDAAIDILNLELLDGRTVGDVLDGLIDLNEKADLAAQRVEKASVKIQSIIKDMERGEGPFST